MLEEKQTEETTASFEIYHHHCGAKKKEIAVPTLVRIVGTTSEIRRPGNGAGYFQGNT